MKDQPTRNPDAEVSAGHETLREIQATLTKTRPTKPAIMNIPSLQERKEFWAWGYANCAFEEVVEGCNFLSNSRIPIPYALRRILIAGIVATYARPFTASHGGHTIPKTVVPKEHLALHQQLMDVRHKEIAHVDAQNYLSDDEHFGNINQVRIRVRNGRNTLSAISSDPPIPQVKHLALILLEKAEYHVGKFRRKYIHSARLADGEYRLSLEESTSSPFIKVPVLAGED